MKRSFLFLLLFSLVGLSSGVAVSQAKPTATRALSPSVFVLFGGTYTGLLSDGRPNVWDGGRNLLFSAGLDLGVLSLGHYNIAAEVRGSLPLISGQVVGDRAILGGARVSYESTPLRPYIDVLAGRGQMDYQRGGYVTPDKTYIQTAGAVYGGGIGTEWDVVPHLALKIDAQAQRWNTPVVARGYVNSVQGSVGLAYRFGAGGRPR